MKEGRREGGSEGGRKEPRKERRKERDHWSYKVDFNISTLAVRRVKKINSHF